MEVFDKINSGYQEIEKLVLEKATVDTNLRIFGQLQVDSVSEVIKYRRKANVATLLTTELAQNKIWVGNVSGVVAEYSYLDEDTLTSNSATAVASQQSIKAYVDSAIAGIGYARRAKVINIVDCTAAPPTEVAGDGYILDATSGTVHANWDGASKLDIVRFNGTSSLWVAETPVEGWVAYLDAQNIDALFVDDGSPAWELRTAAASFYSVNGTLTGARTVTQGSNSVTFTGAVAGFSDLVQINSTNSSLADSGPRFTQTHVSDSGSMWFQNGGGGGLQHNAWNFESDLGMTFLTKEPIALGTAIYPWFDWFADGATNNAKLRFFNYNGASGPTGSHNHLQFETNNGGGSKSTIAFGQYNSWWYVEGASSAGTFTLGSYHSTGTVNTPVITILGSSNDDVGINQTTPAAKLHITGDSGIDVLRVDTNSVNHALFVDTGSYVGISTSTPTHKLQIKEITAGANDEAKNLLSLTSDKNSGIQFKDIISTTEYYTARIYAKYEGVSVGETGLTFQLANTSANTYVDVLRLRSRSTATGKKYVFIRAEDSAAADADLNNNEFTLYFSTNDLIIKRKDNGGVVKTLNLGTLT